MTILDDLNDLIQHWDKAVVDQGDVSSGKKKAARSVEVRFQSLLDQIGKDVNSTDQMASVLIVLSPPIKLCHLICVTPKESISSLFLCPLLAAVLF